VADPGADVTGRDRRARLCAAAVAAVAGGGHLEGDADRRAARGLRELDLDLGGDVGPATAPRPRACEEVVAEEGGEDVREAAEVEVPRLEAAAAQAGVAEPVVELAALRVGEHLVGLCDLPEPLLRVREPADVGMQLAREPPERALDLLLGGRARQTEDLVVVAFGRRH
jgi:hypothetical protein